jgi:hypothetical protein
MQSACPGAPRGKGQAPAGVGSRPAAGIPRSPRFSAGLTASPRLNAVLTSATWENACERLREVAELAPRARVVLLGEETDVVGEREQALEERAGLAPAPLQRVVVGRASAVPGRSPRQPVQCLK